MILTGEAALTTKTPGDKPGVFVCVQCFKEVCL